MSLEKTTWHDTEIGPVKIEAFGDNYLNTTTEIYWNHRIFRLDRYMTSLVIEEYEGKPLDTDVINTWSIPFPADPMTGEEVWKWFWFLVVTNDPERLAAHKQKLAEFYLLRGQQQSARTHENDTNPRFADSEILDFRTNARKESK